MMTHISAGGSSASAAAMDTDNSASASAFINTDNLPASAEGPSTHPSSEVTGDISSDITHFMLYTVVFVS